MAKNNAAALAVPSAPEYLSGSLRVRFEELAPKLVAMGTLTDLEADLLAKLIISENNYLKISNEVQRSLAAGDAETAGKWITAQDKLTKQILTISAELGLTPASRKARGIILNI